MHIYVIRHGESLGNILQSDVANCDLSSRGETHAERIVGFFKEIGLTRIFCSPLKRTIQTALPLAEKKGLKIILVPEMCEIFKREWTNLWEYDWEDCATIESMYPAARFIASHERSRQWWPMQAEEPVQVMERTGQFFKKELLPLAGSKEHVAIFGHGASTTQLRKHICPEAVYPKINFNNNAVIYEYELDSTGRCMEYEMHYQHIQDVLSPPKNREH